MEVDDSIAGVHGLNPDIEMINVNDLRPSGLTCTKHLKKVFTRMPF